MEGVQWAPHQRGAFRLQFSMNRKCAPREIADSDRIHISARTERLDGAACTHLVSRTKMSRQSLTSTNRYETAAAGRWFPSSYAHPVHNPSEGQWFDARTEGQIVRPRRLTRPDCTRIDNSVAHEKATGSNRIGSMSAECISHSVCSALIATHARSSAALSLGGTTFDIYRIRAYSAVVSSDSNASGLCVCADIRPINLLIGLLQFKPFSGAHSSTACRVLQLSS
jgi:hypothetical protein